MPEFDVTEELQAYLVAQGVGVLPADHDGASPVVILSPRDGAPQPSRDGTGRFGSVPTVTLSDIVTSRPNDLDYAIEETFVAVVVRAVNNGTAKMLQRTIRGLLVPGDAVGGRKMFQMGAILVERCVLWRGDQPIGADSQSYDRSQAFMFQVRRKVLAGQPYP